MSISADLFTALPEIFLTCSAIALLMLGVFRGAGSLKIVLNLAMLAVVAALVLVVTKGSSASASAFGDLFLTNGFVVFMKTLTLIGAAVTMFMSGRYLAYEGMNRFELPVLQLFATVGMLLMISASDFMSLYMGLELQSLALYVTAAIRRDNLKASEAGLKYFVLGALSSGLLLYGISLVYGFSGTTNFSALAEVLSAEQAAGHAPAFGLVVGLVFIIAALAFKVSAVPFHMWTPDVYEGAPTSVTAFFAVAPKIAALALFVRVLMGPFADMVDQWQQVIILISILSMAVGAFGALTQRNIKRLMAYSSIGHVGFALIGLAAATEEGIAAIGVYLAIYLLMNVGAFACILAMRNNGRMVEGIDDLKGLSKTSPLMAIALGLIMFSMAGIPPLAGFIGKYVIFLAAIQEGLVTLAVLGVLSSVVSAFYYLRIVKIMYFDEVQESFDAPMGGELKLVLTVSAVFVSFFILITSPLLDAASVSAAALFG